MAINRDDANPNNTPLVSDRSDAYQQTNTTAKFTIIHGSRSLFEFLIPKSLRILAVTGNNIKRWDVVGSESRDANNDNKSMEPGLDRLVSVDGGDDDDVLSGQDTNRVLKVWLEYGMEDEYRLEVVSELEMPSESTNDILVPRLQALGINREKGFVGVEARTNVEINEAHTRGLGRIGTSELPAELVSKSPNPILLAYKFLQGGETLLKLNIKKHKDVRVRESVCD